MQEGRTRYALKIVRSLEVTRTSCSSPWCGPAQA